MHVPTRMHIHPGRDLVDRERPAVGIGGMRMVFCRNMHTHYNRRKASTHGSA